MDRSNPQQFPWNGFWGSLNTRPGVYINILKKWAVYARPGTWELIVSGGML